MEHPRNDKPLIGDDAAGPLLLPEGLHVLHLYYTVDHGQWRLLSEEERRAALGTLRELVGDIRSQPQTQLLAFSVVGPRADLGFMLLTPDLQEANRWEKALNLALGPDILHAVYSYFSVTEGSEYTTTAAQYSLTLAAQGQTAGTPEHDQALAAFEERMAHYRQHRLYPVLPDWPVLCFYPMSKKRDGADNWYSLDYETRRRLMAGHAETGKRYKGRVLQLITGSTGLDESEWGVTLLAHTAADIKEIVYEMRFDEVSARFGEFGTFLIGLPLPLDELIRRLRL